ncbi:MAG TPA: DnaJ domain-containing protein, partial [Myxococcaceae bacterium]|nr:DnaJ domain-containing protein [Myxococcaceae bacterium]
KAPSHPGDAPPVVGRGTAAQPAPAARSGQLSREQLAELERLHLTMHRLDYFELLGLEKSAPPGEIKKAFYKISRSWHPDRFYQLTDHALKKQVHEVYKRMTEAYATLRDDTKRPKYVRDVTGAERPHKLRFTEQSEVEARQQKKKEAEEQIGSTPKGRQFYLSGIADLEAGRWSQAERNLKMAVTFEPQNARYKEKLQEAQQKLHEHTRGQGSQFKIR